MLYSVVVVNDVVVVVQHALHLKYTFTKCVLYCIVVDVVVVVVVVVVVDVVDVVVVVVVVQHALDLKCTFIVVTQDALKAGLFLPSPVTSS